VESLIAKNGGTNCGWDAADHKDFLRIRTKHGNKLVTLASVQELLRAVPNIDAEAIKEHSQRYEVYQELTEQKKALL